MWELLTANQNYAFAIALGLMLVIALLEGTALLLGAGLSEFLEAMLQISHLIPPTDHAIPFARGSATSRRQPTWTR